jgi:hypothetical protein
MMSFIFRTFHLSPFTFHLFLINNAVAAVVCELTIGQGALACVNTSFTRRGLYATESKRGGTL